ncbi:membrane protein insertase YidC [Bacillus horti]|uniref:Membrane protein insertase YidC n=1 Tax=Caldalkalibacillus horti TaxID=77523 RepID=A0ABT9W1H5_9BACI|nr:membrane protein insertase YidC [Bacillus horti]MDQ0167107.1 YidC/Oxa1 family membrane protein insertase [Bacillus horti]
MSRKLLLIPVLMILMIVLAGCGMEDSGLMKPIDPENGFWDRYFVFPLAWLLEYFATTLNSSGDPAFDMYGLAIIIVTILLRLLTLPLMIKQLKSSKMMQALQPEMQKIREKYQKDQQKMQQETMKLFQSHNVNPLAGCLPLLVQMPILIAFYQAVYRHSDIPGHTFLGIELGQPFWGLAILAGITTYIQQKMMGTQQMNPQMKVLLVIMPVMITVFAFYFPAALSLYWVVGNLFTIVQYYFMRDMYKLKTGDAAK